MPNLSEGGDYSVWLFLPDRSPQVYKSIIVLVNISSYTLLKGSLHERVFFHFSHLNIIIHIMDVIPLDLNK